MEAMQVNIQRKSILITPEGPQDVAFIEDTLGLKTIDDLIVMKRVDVPVNGGVARIIGIESIVNLLTSTDKEPKEQEVTPVESLESDDKNDDDDGDTSNGGSSDGSASDA
jgi:hypothetical protein